MSGRGALFVRCVLIALPVIASLLWLSSGRERLTKHERFVTIQRTDDLFGGTETVSTAVPGPRWTFGYYVGLDAVGMTVAVSLVFGAAWWWLGRHRAQASHMKEMAS
jgi:hypothetical protein